MLGVGELDLIVRDLARTLGAQAGLLAVADQTAETVEVLATWGTAESLDRLPIPLTDGFVGRALQFERATLEPIDPQRNGSGPGLLGTGSRYAVGVAVRTADARAGVLCAGFSHPPEDLAETFRLMEALGRLASVCLQDPGVLDGMLTEARLDGLTGCLNYTALRHELRREIRRSTRHRLSLSCCFIDLDDFKRVNDRYGHLYGSQMLVEVATALRSGLRSEDMLGRYGGDEFVAILPETDEDAALKLAERLRATIQTTMMTGAFGQIDASIGVAEWLPGSSPDQLLEHADRALRATKRAAGGVAVPASALPGRGERRIAGAVG